MKYDPEKPETMIEKFGKGFLFTEGCKAPPKWRGLFARYLSMIAFQAACWDDPEELFGSQGFRLSADPESQMAVFFADAERKDLLQMEEATGDILPLFVVNGLDHASVIVRLFDFSVWIVKEGFSRRGPGQNLPPTVGKERERCP
jgi:hypothetical protein